MLRKRQSMVTSVWQSSLCRTLFQIKRKRAKIRNRYNQASHLTQDTNGKVATSQLDITSESQEVNPFLAGDHKVAISFILHYQQQINQNSEYDQEIPHSQTADKLKFKWQFCESRLTMKVSNASKTCYEKVHSTSIWKDLLHIHRFSPSNF